MSLRELIFKIVVALMAITGIVLLFLSFVYDIGQPSFGFLLLSMAGFAVQMRNYKNKVNEGKVSKESFNKSIKAGLIGGLVALLGFVVFTVIMFAIKT